MVITIILELVREKMEHKSLNNALKSKRLNQMYDSDVTDIEWELVEYYFNKQDTKLLYYRFSKYHGKASKREFRL